MHYLDESLIGAKASVSEDCTNCGTCQVRCAFLQENGTPREILAKGLVQEGGQGPNPFECSLCGLCSAVCPVGLKPDAVFLEMRRELVRQGRLDLKPYRPILTYEKLGDSQLFSHLSLPTGGDTVLFPGCTLPATRPQTVKRLFRALQAIEPRMGISLGCCMKPSHDLGREDIFDDRFGALHERLLDAGVKRILTACPNCQKIFSQYGSPMEVVPVARLLADSAYAPVPLSGPPVVVHDPCPQRYDRETQTAVRTLVERCGMELQKMPTQGAATRCCGEGGMVGFVRPEFAKAWTEQRVKAAKGRRVVTSCAGCVNYLGKEVDAVHILDAVFHSKPKLALKAPFTYMARLWLKSWFKRVL